MNIINKIIKNVLDIRASCNKGAFVMPKIKAERNIDDKFREIKT